MSAELLGYKIIRKSDGKQIMYVGVIPMLNKKLVDDLTEKFPTSRYIWVEFRKISSPKTSMYNYKK